MKTKVEKFAIPFNASAVSFSVRMPRIRHFGPHCSSFLSCTTGFQHSSIHRQQRTFFLLKLSLARVPKSWRRGRERFNKTVLTRTEKQLLSTEGATDTQDTEMKHPLNPKRSRGIFGLFVTLSRISIPVVLKPVMEYPQPCTFLCLLPHLSHLIQLISSLVETASDPLVAFWETRKDQGPKDHCTLSMIGYNGYKGSSQKLYASLF